jgi:hypothetical protein
LWASFILLAAPFLESILRIGVLQAGPWAAVLAETIWKSQYSPKTPRRIVLEIYSVKHVWESTSVYPGLPTNDGHALYDYEMVKGPDDIWRAKLSNLRQYANSGLIYAFGSGDPTGHGMKSGAVGTVRRALSPM